MRNDQSSRTSVITACYRAYHALYDDPKIFDDFLAHRLLTEDEFVSFKEQMLAGFQASAPEIAASFPNQESTLAFMMQVMATPALIYSRARYAEDRLEKAIREGVRQYVILGAGMDTFTFRQPELVKMLQVYEVDLPATQDFKRLRLKELGWECPPQLHFIPADFTKESLATVLARSSYDPKRLSFFNWLGVTYYLPRDIVFSTLQAIAESAPVGSTVVFDYFDTDILIPEKSTPRAQQILLLADQVGEPIQAVFDPTTLSNDLARVGFCLEENPNPSEIQERYFLRRADSYYACENAHFACAVVDKT